MERETDNTSCGDRCPSCTNPNFHIQFHRLQTKQKYILNDLLITCQQTRSIRQAIYREEGNATKRLAWVLTYSTICLRYCIFSLFFESLSPWLIDLAHLLCYTLSLSDLNKFFSAWTCCSHPSDIAESMPWYFVHGSWKSWPKRPKHRLLQLQFKRNIFVPIMKMLLLIVTYNRNWHA